MEWKISSGYVPITPFPRNEAQVRFSPKTESCPVMDNVPLPDEKLPLIQKNLADKREIYFDIGPGACQALPEGRIMFPAEVFAIDRMEESANFILHRSGFAQKSGVAEPDCARRICLIWNFLLYWCVK